MGFIRTHHFSHAVDVTPKSDTEHIESVDVILSQADHVEIAEILNETTENTTKEVATIGEDNTYPILPKGIQEKSLPLIAPLEVQERDGEEGRRLWIAIDSTVLDCTTFIHRHPGGQQIIRGFGGQDCSWQWWTFHGRQVWDDVATNLRVGRVEGLENRYKRPEPKIGLRRFGWREGWE